MSHRHLSKGDETSALIAAEIANKKFSGFGSTFAMYAGLLSRLPDRAAESRDAARVCLRLSLSTAGMTTEDFVSIARLAELAEESDTPVEAMTKLHLMYEKIRVLAQSDDQARSGKSIHQLAIEKASYLLDTVALKGSRWGEIRQDLGNIFEQAGRPNIAEFVDPSRCT